MNRTKAFGLIAVLSTLLLTASLASAHGRSTLSRPKLAKAVHTARVAPMARAAHVKVKADPVPPISYPTESSSGTPSTDPCYTDDDSSEGTGSEGSDSTDGSDDSGTWTGPPTVPPTTGGTCSYTDDDSSSTPSSNMDD